MTYFVQCIKEIYIENKNYFPRLTYCQHSFEQNQQANANISRYWYIDLLQNDFLIKTPSVKTHDECSSYVSLWALVTDNAIGKVLEIKTQPRYTCKNKYLPNFIKTLKQTIIST